MLVNLHVLIYSVFNGMKIPNITVKAADEKVQFVNKVVSFGVVLDSTLSWKPPVNHVTKKVSRALFGLKIIRSCTTQALRRRLLESLVVSHLGYCAVVYFDASSTISRLQRLANAGVRCIFGVRRDTQITP